MGQAEALPGTTSCPASRGRVRLSIASTADLRRTNQRDAALLARLGPARASLLAERLESRASALSARQPDTGEVPERSHPLPQRSGKSTTSTQDFPSDWRIKGLRTFSLTGSPLHSPESANPVVILELTLDGLVHKWSTAGAILPDRRTSQRTLQRGYQCFGLVAGACFDRELKCQC